MEQVVISEHTAFMRELNKGVVVATTPEIYDHFLNVLPPAQFGHDFFTFKEGEDSIHFWKGACGGRYARVRSAMVADSGYNRYVLVVAKRRDDPFVVYDHYGMPDAMGKEFPTLEALANDCDLLAHRN